MNLKKQSYLFVHGEETSEHEVAGDLHDLPDVVREEGGGEEEEEDGGQRHPDRPDHPDHPDRPHSSHRTPGIQHGAVWKVSEDCVEIET